MVEGIDWCENPVLGFMGYVPCRKCATCQRIKSWKWVQRALDEMVFHPRTWFVTLTFRRVPDDPYVEVQKWLKRVRKELGDDKIRYLCAQERGGRGGRLHFHLLVHGSAGLSGRMVRAQWRGGITHARLVHGVGCKAKGASPAAGYVAKYATKDNRVRASGGYGQRGNSECTSNPVVAAIFAHFPEARLQGVEDLGSGVSYRPPRPTSGVSRKRLADRGPTPVLADFPKSN